MNVLEAMVENTRFEVEVLARDTSYNEGMFTPTSDYHLNCDKERMKFVSSQGYNYAGLEYYDLNVA